MAGKSKVAILIGSAFDAKGFKQAETASQKLSKTLKNLGVALSAGAIVKFGKDAANAFIQDQKEATRLTQAIKNLGLELSAPSLNRYVESLSQISGVTDSELRPALQALLTTTGSVTASQKALQQAIDISAGSGFDLLTVSQDLANAYVGNTRGLKKYNLGLTQAELKTASFEDISGKLNKQFSGANAAYLDTYAGKLQLLGTAAGEAQERLGGAVIDLAMALTGAGDVEELINKINTATDFAVARLDNFIEGWKTLKAIIKSSPGEINKAIQKVQVEEYNRRLARDYMKVWEGTNLPINAKELAARKAAEAAAAKRAKELAALTKAQTKAQKDQATLKKASSIFDLTQIQIIAALKGNISADERKRLELQLALATENTTEAQKLTYQLAISQGLTTELAKTLASLPDAKNPFEAWKDYLDKIEKQASRIAGMGTGGGTGGGGAVIPPTNASGAPLGVTPSMQPYILSPELQAGINARAAASGQTVVVQIDGKTIATALQDQSLSGVNPAVNRFAFGGFGY